MSHINQCFVCMGSHRDPRRHPPAGGASRSITGLPPGDKTYGTEDVPTFNAWMTLNIDVRSDKERIIPVGLGEDVLTYSTCDRLFDTSTQMFKLLEDCLYGRTFWGKLSYQFAGGETITNCFCLRN